MVEEISVQELKSLLDSGNPVQLIDVRPEEHFHQGHVKSVYIQNIPLQELPGRIQELDSKRTIYVICNHGNASRYAAAYLGEEDYEVYSVAGGTAAWAENFPEQMKIPGMD